MTPLLLYTTIPHHQLQSRILLGDNSGVVRLPRGRPTLKSHKELEGYLGRYGGLMLYLKEMEEGVYEKLCVVSAVRFIAVWYSLLTLSLR